MADPKKFYTYNRNYIDTKLGHGLSYSLASNVLTLNLLDKTGNVISTQAITLSGKIANVKYLGPTDASHPLSIEVSYADGTATSYYPLVGVSSKLVSTVSGDTSKIELKDVNDTVLSTVDDMVFRQESQTLKNKTINTNENTITKGTNANDTTPLFGIVEADGVSIKSTGGVLSVDSDYDKYTIEKQATATATYLTTYKLKRTLNGVDSYVGDAIDIPKDYLVKSATVKECTTADDPVAGMKVGDKYIDFVVNTKDSTTPTGDTHLYIQFKDFISAYTAGDGLKLDTDKFSVDLTANGGLKLDGTVAGDKTLNAKVDDSTLEIDTTNGIQVKDSGIVTVKIADTNVTLAKLNDDVATKIYDIKLLSDVVTDPDYGVLEFTQLRANS